MRFASVGVNPNQGFKTDPRFGSVKLVIQSKTFEKMDVMEVREKAEMTRIIAASSNGGQYIKASSLKEKLLNLLGEVCDQQVFKAQAEEKFGAFMQRMKEIKGPDYQALFLHVGRKEHPRDRSRTVPMRLLIDGEDLQKLQQSVWQRAFFALPLTGAAKASVFDAKEYGSGNRLGRAFDDVVREWTQSKINDYADGDRQDLIDLDAMPRV